MASIRLSKAAKEFNVGIHTLVEFLQSKGIEIIQNPNTKIEEDTYSLLLEEFSQEKEDRKKIKEANDKRSLIQDQIKDSNKKDSPELIEKRKVDVGPVVLGQIDLNKFNKKNNKKEEKETIEEEKIEDIVINETVEEVQEQKEEIKRVELPKQIILGKIDLSPKKKKENKKTEIPEKENDQEKTNIISDSHQTTNEIAINDEKGELINNKRKVIEGPKILGKIEGIKDKFEEIEKEKQRKEEDKEKRKAEKKQKKDGVKTQRKRIKKTNIEVDSKNPKPVKDKKGINKSKKPEIDQEAIKKQVKDSLAKLKNKTSQNKKDIEKFKRERKEERLKKREELMIQEEVESNIIKVAEYVTAQDLSNMMNIEVNEIIQKCFLLGVIVNINQRLDAETISLIVEEFGFEVEFVSVKEQLNIDIEEDNDADLIHRTPIVTVMGHVDHGKTSLLDFIRKSRVAEKEAGGITQHIGAYKVKGESGREITFLDTPGHEAFTAMRARGAAVTDIAIIIIAATDRIMPQTKEAINHAQAASVPIVFAINKIDLPGANPEKIKEELATMNILVESWGGTYYSYEISAKTGVGIEELLEGVLFQAELLDLKANPNRNAVGTILESSLDKGKGFVTNLLVENGTLKIGDIILAGDKAGKIKAMIDEHGEHITSVGPASPISILGLNGAVMSGDKFFVMNDEREAKDIAAKRAQLQREQTYKTRKHITLDEIGRRLAVGDFKELKLIIKGDVQGSVEALSAELQKLSTNAVFVNVIHSGVGQIIESDVMLASASDAIIIGFQVRPDAKAKETAQREEVEIRTYSVIFKAIGELEDAIKGMLTPKLIEKIIGNVEVRATFKVNKIGTIAGCFVMNGIVKSNSKVRIIRDGIVVKTTKISSLKREKDNAKEVKKGYECGILLDGFNEINEFDELEIFEQVEEDK